MKHNFILISLVLFCACAFFACEEEQMPAGPDYTLTFEENPVMVSAVGGACSATVIADVEYTVGTDVDWITDVVMASQDEVTFNVAPNDADGFRDGALNFLVAGTTDTVRLTVRQIAYLTPLKTSVDLVNFETAGGEREVKIVSRNDWEVESVSAPWVKAVKKNSSALSLSSSVNYTGEELEAEVVIASGEEKVTVSVTQESDNSIFYGASTQMGRRFAYNSDGLVLTVLSDKSYSLGENVNMLEIKYSGAMTGNVLPYSVYVYEVNLEGPFTIAATCADDDDSAIRKTDAQTTLVQTTTSQLSVLEASRGKEILGGVNADFFFGEGSEEDRNNLLHGVMHRRGVCLKDTFDGGPACNVFAVMSDGTARILSQSAYADRKSDIAEAVGGRQIVLSAGEVATAKNGKMDPRTAVGVSSDYKTVYLLVVDGRRSVHSNGAEYEHLGKMFKALGAYNAMNLDGGGSSTFVVKENDAFVIRNKPSDDKERAVVNGLAIIER